MVKHKPTASVDLIRGVLKYAGDMGIELDDLLESDGLDQAMLDAGGGRITIGQFNTLWQQIADRSNDPDFGLHLAETSTGLLTNSLLVAVLMNCPTIGAAMEKLCRYHDLSTDFIRLRLINKGEQAYYTWEPVSDDIHLQRDHSEAMLTSMALMLQRLAGVKLDITAIHFTHIQPANTHEHARILRYPLAFGQVNNELVLRRDDLEIPIKFANPGLLHVLENFADEQLAQLKSIESWSDQVIHFIRQDMLQGEKPTLTRVASRLAVSQRHLQKRLKAEGTTYRSLFDSLRRELAIRYLARPEVLVVDVAFLLGFSEQSSFDHAFKRWTGCSPQAYRMKVD